jgi:predicted RNase H-like HicB family nuclease
MPLTSRTYSAVVEYDKESKMYIASVPALPPVHTQASTIEQLHERLKEAIELCLEEIGDHEEPLQFIGIHQVDVNR